VLALRAGTELERSSWVSALLAAQAEYHPHSSHLSTHVPLSERERTPSTSAPTLERAVTFSRGGSARTFVPVPSGLRPGQRFMVEVPSGERFSVVVPVGASDQIEVLVPARCMNEVPPPASATPHGSNSLAPVPPGLPPAPSDARDKGDVAWTLCRRFEVTLTKAVGMPLGLALAPSRAGHLTVTDVTAGGIAEQMGAFHLGDMLVALNDEPLTADIDAFVANIRALDGCELRIGMQRVEDEEALQLLLEQVSAEQHRLELEKRRLSQGIRASQEASLLEVAMERSLSLAHQVVTRDSSEEADLQAAIDQSIAQQEEESSVRVTAASALDHAVNSTAVDAADRALLDAAILESQEMYASSTGPPVYVGDSEGNGYGGLIGGNAVRALEENIARSEGMRAVETAAAARSRTATGAASVSSAAGSAAAQQARSDVYEAQHRFVLAQLTAPGVEAFLADDWSDDEDEGDADNLHMGLSRTASKFV